MSLDPSVSVTDEVKTLIAKVSKNVEAISRRIRSPKNTLEDFEILSDSLELSAVTLRKLLNILKRS